MLNYTNDVNQLRTLKNLAATCFIFHVIKYSTRQSFLTINLCQCSVNGIDLHTKHIWHSIICSTFLKWKQQALRGIAAKKIQFNLKFYADKSGLTSARFSNFLPNLVVWLRRISGSNLLYKQALIVVNAHSINLQGELGNKWFIRLLHLPDHLS